MKPKFKIEPFDEHDKVTFYTIRIGDDETEADKFLNKFPEGCEYDNDINIIIKWIDQIGERGAQERYFRIEGKISDNIWAVPIEKSSLRLYLIRLSEQIVILGNGGVKTTKTYNEDPILNSYVKLLQEVDGYIRKKIEKRQFHIYQKKIFGI